MNERPLASIIISSYNYERYVREAIESALNQTHARTEVIVVDDGSTDSSPQIIRRYGGRLLPVLKANGGQASALNAGFAVSRGRIVLFLDSDDVLLPTAVERAAAMLHESDVVKVHWHQWVIDEESRRTGAVDPPYELPEGDLRETLIGGGPGSSRWPPTSGNAWARQALERIFPIPEAEFRVCPDFYLSTFVPLFGRVRRIDEPQGCWRVHGGNSSWRQPFEEWLGLELRRWEYCCGLLSDYCRAKGIAVDPQAWRANSWFHRVRLATQEIAAIIPRGEVFILADQDEWRTDEQVAGRRRVPFVERDGQYWGAPADDATAIGELERLREAGAGFMVVGWPAFWWLDHYAGLHHYLRSKFGAILENDRLVVFDVRR